MKATGIIRRIDDLGRLAIPRDLRKSLKIYEGDAFEMFVDGDGTITFKPCYKSWEQCAIDFHNSHPRIFQDKTATYAFYHHGCYTVCFINSCSVENSRIGTAKRHVKDSHDYRIGKVAAYARAIGQPINEVIDYKGK